MPGFARLVPVLLLLGCAPSASRREETVVQPAADTLVALTCRPNPVVRAQWLVCRMNDPRYRVTRWHFHADPDSANPPMPDVENSSSSWEWAGPVVIGGLVTVFVRDSAEREHAFQEHVTVSPREYCWPCTWSLEGGSGDGPTSADAPPDSAAASPAASPAIDDDSVLARHGQLKLQSYSIHGAAPLILLVTQAPAWAGERERYYRRQFTESLTRWIAMRGLSYYILSDVGGDSPFVTPAETLDRLDAATRDVAASLWRKQLPPVAFVGLAEGAVVAARAAARAPFPTELAALAPSLPARAGKQPPAWDDVTQGLLNHVPGLLAIQSACDGPMPEALVRAADFRHRLVIVPNVDSWLGLMRDGVCTGERPTPGLVPGLSVVRMVAEWLGGTVIFPE